jgi:glycosyltransferase involved in cell wall biosynthesis
MPTIAHHKYSTEDGHVAQQILRVPGYRGILMVTEKTRPSQDSPFKKVYATSRLKSKKFIKRKGIVAVHAHHGILGVKLMPLCRKQRLPLIVSFRGKDVTSYPRNPKNRKKLRKLFAKGALFLPVCRHLANRLVRLGCPPKKIRILYGGTDIRRFRYQPRTLDSSQEPVKFLAIGRFVEKKGFHHLLKAFKKAQKKTSQPMKLLLVGEGEMESQYRQTIKALNLENRVEIRNWMNYRQIHNVYHRCHIFCTPSCTDNEGNQEGIPNTLKEAMATGMPVISTYHAGIPELVENKKSGLLVKERDIKALAKSIVWMAEHPAKWRAFGKRGRKKIVRDFNLAKQLKKQKAYYDELLR